MYNDEYQLVKRAAEELVNRSLKERAMKSNKETPGVMYTGTEPHSEGTGSPYGIVSSQYGTDGNDSPDWWEQPDSAEIMLGDELGDGKGHIWDYKKAKWIKKDKSKDGIIVMPSKGKNKDTSGGYNFGIGAKQYEYKPPCKHPPTEVLIGKGWSVHAGKKWDCEDHGNDFDIVLNLMGTSIQQQHIMPIPELQKWEHGGQRFKEIMLNWPDMGVVTLPLDFWMDLYNYVDKNHAKMLVFCMGGHGRTGTAIASMLVAWFGYDADKAMNWVWDSYCEKAIESDKQEKYIEWIDQQRLALKKKK